MTFSKRYERFYQFIHIQWHQRSVQVVEIKFVVAIYTVDIRMAA